MTGPRIYQLTAARAGAVDGWHEHVPRAAAMQFDWIALPPLTEPFDLAGPIAALSERAAAAGLRVMVEVVAGEPDAFAGEVRRFAGAGIAGFCCAGAHRIPAGSWPALLAAARAAAPGAVFVGDALGAPLPAVSALRPARFDYLFNSAGWWDFRSDWLLEQYDRFRHVAPSIAFPRSAGSAAADRFRYAFAASFSSGVLMPMGYEDGSSGSDDLRADITRINAMKAAVPALNEEGPQSLIVREGRIVGLARHTVDERETAIVLFNAVAGDALTVRAPSAIRPPAPGALVEVAPAAGAETAAEILLAPFALRVFATPPDRLAPAGNSPVKPGPCVIEGVTPQIDGGRHAVKRRCGAALVVEADVFREGHDPIAVVLRYREVDHAWRETPMRPLGNDRWTASFVPATSGRWEYAIEAWPDAFAAWHHDTLLKRDAAATIALELIEGRELLESARIRAEGPERAALHAIGAELDAAAGEEAKARVLLADRTYAAMAAVPDRSQATRSAALPLIVDRRAAEVGAWYEFFPRSTSEVSGRHGTFADAERQLPRIRDLGFDVVYLPPIHPIGHAFRKGRNNSLDPQPDDPGSPWAIGNRDGGHCAVEPQLGTLADFDRFVAAANAAGLEVALDYALQCSPDHPYVREHPEWFAFRPDGSIKYAENPPKKYQDIVNFNWYGPHAAALWNELRDIVLFWIGHGVRIFRVDNPHTKPFAFWEWMIADVQAQHPGVLFLAEAFTRPRPMQELAKVGFTQSYTYFTWRDTREELAAFVGELASAPLCDFYRPNFFANTPDILPPILQTGGRPAFLIRLYLAATLSSLYGIYSGYEIGENAALPGREEYADSEKFELRPRNYDAPGNLNAEIRSINRLRHEHPALQDWRNVRFLEAESGDVLFYMKSSAADTLLVAVNVNPFRPASAQLHVPLDLLGIDPSDGYDVENLLSGERYVWRGRTAPWYFDPQNNPAAIFRIDRRAPRLFEDGP